MSEILFFTYGTLRKGCLRHPIVEPYKCLVSKAKLKDFAMYSLGPFPTILQEEGATVLGEIYNIDSKCLMTLDYVEGYNPRYPEGSFYRRIEIVAEDSDGNKYPCATYSFTGDPVRLRANGARRIDSGDWLRFIGEEAWD